MAEEGGPGRQRVALKRYVTIARRVEEEVPPGGRMALWRELAAEHGVTVRTLQRRYRRFRQAGSLEGLMPPARRADAGSLRAMPEAVLAAAAQLRREQPARSTRILILLLEERFPELKGRIGRVTLDRHLRRLGLTRRRLQEAGRVLRRFQSPHRNALWLADFNFPALQWRNGSELSPTVILAILDHATRRLMHFAAHPARDAQAVERGLQEAIAAFGLPGRFYTDNGSELVSRLVLGALGELGIRHVASTVGVPEGRGAIERFFRTFEESFLPEMAAKAMVPTLDELNRYLLAWAREGYERNPHDGLAGRTPLQAGPGPATPGRVGASLWSLPAARGPPRGQDRPNLGAWPPLPLCRRPGGGAGAGAFSSRAPRPARATLAAGPLPPDGLPLRPPGRGAPAAPRRPQATRARPERSGHL
jgi:transposase InsO family protein